MARNYSNIALDTTLTAGITAVDLTCIVASAAGWPAVPFAAVLDPGSLTVEEVVQVTLKVGTTFTITRGFDGTTASAHALGATVRHAAIAGDFTDLQTADAAIASAISTHAGLTTSAHGGIVAATDPRLTDSRTPNAHAIGGALHTGSLTDALHGNLGGGALHPAVVAAGASGFMTGADKAKLDGIAAGAQVGTVTSVALTVPGVLFSVAGSPITGAGTLALSLLTQTANTVLAGPVSGGAATPTMRALVAADIPAISLTAGVSGILPSANGGTGVNNAGTLTNASNTTITGGGTLALGGFTATIAKTGTIPVGTGTAGRIAEWVTDANTLQASTLAKTGATLLSLYLDASTNLGVGATFASLSSGSSSVAIGSGALGALSSGTRNVAIGTNAALNTATGTENVAIGEGALQTNINSGQNMAIGYGALGLTTSANSIAVGRTAGGNQSTGSENIYIGTDAGKNNTTGFQSVFIGSAAGYGSTGAGARSQNVLIGYIAGYSLAAGSAGNVMIGNQAGSAVTGSNQLIIENSNSLRPLISGSFSADTLTFYATDSATGAVRTQTTLDYSSSGTPAAGFGSRSLVALKSSTTDSQSAADWSTSWVVATHASRTARIVGSVYDTAARTWITAEASGTVAKLGLYNAAAVVQPAAITAPTGGVVIDAEARTAIGLILTALGAAAGGIGITA